MKTVSKILLFRKTALLYRKNSNLIYIGNTEKEVAKRTSVQPIKIIIKKQTNVKSTTEYLFMKSTETKTIIYHIFE